LFIVYIDTDADHVRMLVRVQYIQITITGTNKHVYILYNI